MAGAISARWMGSVEGQAVVWKIAQIEWTSYAMGLQDRDREESVATEVCVRAVDARLYCGPVLRHPAELMLPAVDLCGRVWPGGKPCKGGPAAPAFGG